MKPAAKSLNLPKPIAAYFTADRGDGEAVSQCFTENAVVKDEGHTHKGRAAIKEWKTAGLRQDGPPLRRRGIQTG